ncbi:hypothetical protein CC78DRAFT_195734 [Lojkania enalia]|uniref:Uncharacterized protein n=1 Tax=Lojkania enalia TaxID=147567 RepID=A0A9P4NBI7_9PLEO|nr:hypothetical protein CC78DRAFT_195734 [Didymosphaeria enalia]
MFSPFSAASAPPTPSTSIHPNWIYFKPRPKPASISFPLTNPYNLSTMSPPEFTDGETTETTHPSTTTTTTTTSPNINTNSFQPSRHNAPHISSLLHHAHSHPSHLTMPFSTSGLYTAFQTMAPIFRVPDPGFYFDVCILVRTLPVREGEVVEWRGVAEALIAAAREEGMRWWGSEKERVAVWVGVLGACVVQRAGREVEGGCGLAGPLWDDAKVQCEGVGEEQDVLERLAEELRSGLSI